jgi:DNA-binding MarR family transcriptional regulator
MEDTKKVARELSLLEEIERDPDTDQLSLATRLGVAVGTVNWHIKRLVAKGYVKVKRAERRKLRYIITPKGIALRTRLTVAYVENSMALYRQTRKKSRLAVHDAVEKGFKEVYIDGDGDIADVCRLTCFEFGLDVLEQPEDSAAPKIEIQGKDIHLILPED